jgi:hypothetical protein
MHSIPWYKVKKNMLSRLSGKDEIQGRQPQLCNDCKEQAYPLPLIPTGFDRLVNG